MSKPRVVRLAEQGDPIDRELAQQIIDTAIEQRPMAMQGKAPRPGDLAYLCSRLTLEGYDAGDPDTVQKYQGILAASCSRFFMGLLRQRIRSENTVQVAYNGKVLGVPARAALVDTDKDGAPVRSFTYPLWLDIPRAEFDRIYQRRRAHSDGELLALRAFDFVAAVWNLYPHAKTGREALTLAGIDPDAVLDLSKAMGDGAAQ